MKKLFMLTILIAQLSNLICAMDNNNAPSNSLDSDSVYELSIEKCKSGDYTSALSLRNSCRILRDLEMACTKNPEAFAEKEEWVMKNWEWLEHRWISAVGEKNATKYAEYIHTLGAEKINLNGKKQLEQIKQMQLPDPKWVFMQLKLKEEWPAARKKVFDRYEKGSEEKK